MDATHDAGNESPSNTPNTPNTPDDPTHEVSQQPLVEKLVSKADSVSGTISPELWGPAFWETIHWTAAGYPRDPTPLDKVAGQRFFQGLLGMLPCVTCRKHFGELIQDSPLEEALESGEILREWAMDLHNAVNERTGSDERWTLQQLNAAYPVPAPGDTVTARATPKATVKASRPTAAVQKTTTPFVATTTHITPSTQPSERDAELGRIRRRSRIIAQRISQQTNFTGRVGVQRSAPNLATLVRRSGVRRRSRGAQLRHPTAVVNRATTTTVQPKKKKKGCGCGAR